MTSCIELSVFTRLISEYTRLYTDRFGLWLVLGKELGVSEEGI